MVSKITFDEAKAAIEETSNDQDIQLKKSAEEFNSEESLTHLDGLKDFYKLRKKWSWSIFGFIVALIAFQIIITSLVGLNILNFEKYPLFLPLVISENFIQIIGLALIVVKFLFSNPKNKK